MTKIDTSGWKKFQVGELFDSRTGSTDIQPQHLSDEGILVVSAGTTDNGIVGRTLEDVDVIPPNSITVDMFGHVFVRDYAYCMVTHARVFALLIRESCSFEALMFVSAVLRGTLTSYDYANMCSYRKIENASILLPVTSDGEPDWVYMGAYMSEVLRESKASLENLGKVEKKFRSANAPDWRQFSIGSLFDIEKGTRLTRAAMVDGDTPFIGATLENNGITARVGNTGHIHPGGLMTVAYNGQKATGKAFYQPIPFWASDDVNVLYPKFSLTENIALFLAPLFWEAGRPYSFGDKWGKDVMENDCLVLPVNASNEPDWAYMDEYMRGEMERAQSDLSAMQSIDQAQVKPAVP